MIAKFIHSSMAGSYYTDCIILSESEETYDIVFWDDFPEEWVERTVNKKIVNIIKERGQDGNAAVC